MRRRMKTADMTRHVLFQVKKADNTAEAVIGVLLVRMNTPWFASMEEAVTDYISTVFPASLFNINYLMWDEPLLVQDYANRNNLSVEIMLPPGDEMLDLTVPF